MNEFRKYRSRKIVQMRPWQPGEKISGAVVIDGKDFKDGSPKAGDMIARNPDDHDYQWLVPSVDVVANFEPIAGAAGEVTQ